MSLNFKYLFTRPKTADSVSVMLARFPQGRCDDPDVTNWLMRQSIQWYNDPRIHTLFMWEKDDTPITLGRNACIEAAKECGADFVLMIDSDMAPDCEPTGKPFWLDSFNFALEQRASKQPCAIAAPYCGPPDHENVYIFQWADIENGRPEDHQTDFHLNQFSREEAARLTGIMEVAALPTGLLLLDMQSIAKLEPPYFYYEYEDDREAKKASTEDVTFTRDLSLRGVPQFCNWDAWAGHWKRKLVRKPKPINSKWVSDKMIRAIKRDFNINPGEELRTVTALQVRKLSVEDREAIEKAELEHLNGVIQEIEHEPKPNGRSPLGFAGYAFRHPDFAGIVDPYARPARSGRAPTGQQASEPVHD